uniref:Uncharacterized protein n=1 Tax=Aegilops tauschii subsp. strangulata TaxID=200361 RepID=A0A453FBV1_AEGTS
DKYAQRDGSVSSDRPGVYCEDSGLSILFGSKIYWLPMRLSSFSVNLFWHESLLLR